MPRPLYLLRYPSYPFKDHWALWIPSPSNPRVGTKIQVEGDVRNGFAHQIERNFDLDIDGRRIHLNELANVRDELVHDTRSGGDLTEDAIPRDEIERLAMEVPAPGGSMNATGGGNAPPGQRIEFNDCQWWVRQVVAKLVHEGIVPESGISVLDAMPRN